MTKIDWKNGYFLPNFPIPPINRLLNARFESHDAEKNILKVSFPTIPEHANPAGFVMGGIITAFLDMCMGPLVVAATEGNQFPITLALNTTYFRPVLIGPRAHVEARIDRISKTYVFLTASVISVSGDIQAQAIQTAALRTASRFMRIEFLKH